jgi:hypothetical protein
MVDSEGFAWRGTPGGRIDSGTAKVERPPARVNAVFARVERDCGSRGIRLASRRPRPYLRHAVNDRLDDSEVFNATGSLIVDYSAVLPGERTITQARPEVREAAVRSPIATRVVTTQILIEQGEALLGEFRGILEWLQDAPAPQVATRRPRATPLVAPPPRV